MSDNSQDLKIHIVSDADTKGFQQVSQASSKLKVDTSDLNEETKRSLGMMPQAEDGLKKTAKASEEAGVSHREQKEALHELTHGYPELGEVARAALNPITIAAFGIAEAFSIWAERIKTAQELMGGWELPDLTGHARGVSAAATAYDQLKTAVAGADTEFDSAAGVFERQATAVQAQLEATKQLIEAQKQKAIADLNIERATGQVSPVTYDARRTMIEMGANAQTTQAEIDARNADLAAKKQEAAQLHQDSASEAAKAGAIQPGRNSEGMQELINEAKAAAEAAGKAAAELHQKEALAKAMRDQEGLESFTPESIATQFKYDMTFGATTNPSEQAKIAEEAAKAAEVRQAALEESAKQLQKQLDERKKHSDESARLAAEAEKKDRGLQGEDDPNKVGSTAWKNAQAAASLRARNDTGLENQFTKDVENFNKDAEELNRSAGRTDPASLVKARQSMADMSAAVQDAMAIMQTLAADHQNVATLAQQVALMKRQINQGSFNNH